MTVGRRPVIRFSGVSGIPLRHHLGRQLVALIAGFSFLTVLAAGALIGHRSSDAPESNPVIVTTPSTASILSQQSLSSLLPTTSAAAPTSTAVASMPTYQDDRGGSR